MSKPNCKMGRRPALRWQGSTFLAARAQAGQMRPEQFLRACQGLRRIVATAQKDLRRLLQSRGWVAHRPSDGPLAVFIKTFPDNVEFRLSESQALRVEDRYCTALTRFER